MSEYERISDGPIGKTGSMNCVVCNFEKSQPIPCMGFEWKGSFIHDSHLALVKGKVVVVKPYGPIVGAIFEKCPDCLGHSCSCHIGDISELSQSDKEYRQSQGRH
jgi:hypothetical protein